MTFDLHPRSRTGRLARLVAGILLPAQLLLCVPAPMFASSRAARGPEPRSAEPAKAPAVNVNRSVPAVKPAPSYPLYSTKPTTDEIRRARVFGEPIVPVGAAPSDDDNKEVAAGLDAFLRAAGDKDQLGALERLDARQPNSPYRASLLMNMGIFYRRRGYFTRAERALREAWNLSKDAAEPLGRAVADAAVGELLDIYKTFGRLAPMEALVDEVGNRPLLGSPAERLREARSGVWVLHNHHEQAVPSGPAALARIRSFLRPSAPPHPAIANFHADADGATLVEMRDLAAEVGLDLHMAKRVSPNAQLVFPAMMHWKVGHYSAVLREENGFLLIDDPCLGGELWLSRDAFEEEASGYFLAPSTRGLDGWVDVADNEGSKISGKCAPANPSGAATGTNNHQVQCTTCQSPAGMVTFSFHMLLGSLHLEDRPVGYTPPRGPAVQALVTYNQRESYKPQTYTFANLGQRWNLIWIAWVEDDPNNPTATAYAHKPGGGRETLSSFNGTSYAPDRDMQSVVSRISSSPIRYERVLPDGSKEVYSQADGASTFPRRVFLTQMVDAQENALSMTYDSQLRLVAVTDAIGQVTTLAYDMTSDPLKVTKITDPFGRSALFEYSSLGQLTRITDVIGMRSEMGYSQSDFIESLTTPYGTTLFSVTSGVNGHTDYGIAATDPLGATERLDWVLINPNVPASDPPASVPTGFASMNNGLANYTAYYWDKRAWSLYPGDYTKARATRWNFAGPSGIADSIGAEKMPLEGRVWYSYAGATVTHGVGPMNKPLKVARVLDDGSSQIYQYEYNSKGKVLRATDPVGRETVYVYGTGSTPDPDQANGTGIDLLQTKQKNGGTYDVLLSATYSTQHLPLTKTDASNQTTTFTYNAAGQPVTVVTPPRAGLTQAQRTTTYAYDSNGYLQSITGPVAGATTSFTYDGYGRTRTVTDPDSYALTYDYDALSRPTRTTYPDTTYEETTYNRLDPEKRRDRLGRWSETFYDALRRSVSTRDPLGRTTTRQWCNCGSLDKILDANGNAVTWERDLQGRVTREVRPDAAAWEYTYENTTSKLKQRKDAKNQLTNYTYFPDNNRQQVTYANAVIATPNVSFTYDPVYNRLATMTDGTGTTTYGYNPLNGSLGSGQLASVDGPLTSDTISYTYEELGRIASRGLSGFSSSLSYDALGRLITQASPVGNFTYSYDGVTPRPLSLSYPNGQMTQYLYFPNSGGRRLQQIKHLAPGAAVISKYDYTYDVVGNIATWTQQAGAATPKVYTLGYDAADQLTLAKVTGPTPLPVPSRYAYAYDPVGNRAAEQLDDAVRGATHNNRNELLSRQPGGAILFRGSVNEAATVTVGGKPAQVATDNTFAAQAAVPSGTSNVVVTATDPSGNLRTNTYQVSESGSTTNYTYDLNGNLTGDGTRTFEWDAENRLTAVKQGPATLASFTYDGQGRRSLKVAGGITITYVYDGSGIIDERLSTGATLKHVDGPGIDQHWATRDGASVVTYFLADHLGSVVQTTNAAGTVTFARDYDPYGSPIAGGAQAGYAYTGREWDPETNLYYYRARYYDPNAGRFISEDPIGSGGGINRYGYAGDNPANLVDPLGLYEYNGGYAGPYPWRGPWPPPPTPPPPAPPSGFQWYGNWGGPGWTGGQWGTWNTINHNTAAGPINMQDFAYCLHDQCYGRCTTLPTAWARFQCRLQCDMDLSNRLLAIILSNQPGNNVYAWIAQYGFSKGMGAWSSIPSDEHSAQTPAASCVKPCK
jgi:RHS repeat-associated protein